VAGTVVRPRRIEVLAANVKKQRLVELLVTNIASELQVVLADSLAEIVRPWKVLHLRNSPSKFAILNPPEILNERELLRGLHPSRVDSYVWISRVRETFASGLLQEFARGLYARMQKMFPGPRGRE